MQGETEERPRKRRKKKSKFGYYLYAVVILVLTITNITLAFLLVTHVQKINVSGTVNSTEEEIKAWLTEDPLTVNSVYTLLKYKTGSDELPVYLDGLKVSLKLPWEVQVDVEEKEIVACVKYKDSYAYIEKGGLVMKVTEELEEGIPYIEKVKVQSAKTFQTLKVKDEKIFTYIKNIIHEIERNEITPDHIAWENDGMSLYFEDVCVELGKSDYDVKISQLPPILENLKGKAGVLRMSHYTETSGSISFEEYMEEVSGETTEETVQEASGGGTVEELPQVEETAETEATVQE